MCGGREYSPESWAQSQWSANLGAGARKCSRAGVTWHQWLPSPELRLVRGEQLIISGFADDSYNVLTTLVYFVFFWIMIAMKFCCMKEWWKIQLVYVQASKSAHLHLTSVNQIASSPVSSPPLSAFLVFIMIHHSIATSTVLCFEGVTSTVLTYSIAGCRITKWIQPLAGQWSVRKFASCRQCSAVVWI